METAKRLTKKPVAMLIILVVIVSLALSTSVFRMSTFAYAKSVPIQLGYEEAKNYWVISSTISETETFKMVLNKGSTDTVDSNEQAKTQSEVGLLFEPHNPYSTTNLVVTNYKYTKWMDIFEISYKQEKVPCYDINDAGWLTTAEYAVGIYQNGVELKKQTVKINYQEPKVINLETPDGTVTINNLGMLPQGVEVPSGDLVIVDDPYGQRHIWDKADLLNMVNKWNEEKVFGGKTFGWGDVWNWAKNKGYLPQDVQLVHVFKFETTFENQYITLYYSDIVFAGLITVYIPEELADTVIINLFMPKPEIVDVNPPELPKIDEGTTTSLAVTVKNVGTRGTLSISLVSTYYAFTPLTTGQKDFAEGETYTFQFTVHALNVIASTATTTEIRAYGRGGTDTKTIKGYINNVPGYTPPTPETEAYLKVTVVDAVSFEPVSGIIVKVKAGTQTYEKTTGTSGLVEFALGKFSGAIKISTVANKKYSASEMTTGVSEGINEVTIKVQSKATSWLWLIAVAGVAVVAVVLLTYGKRRKR